MSNNSITIDNMLSSITSLISPGGNEESTAKDEIEKEDLEFDNDDENDSDNEEDDEDEEDDNEGGDDKEK